MMYPTHAPPRASSSYMARTLSASVSPRSVAFSSARRFTWDIFITLLSCLLQARTAATPKDIRLWRKTFARFHGFVLLDEYLLFFIDDLSAFRAFGLIIKKHLWDSLFFFYLILVFIPPFSKMLHCQWFYF